jgi:hypothetical protein
MLIDKYLSKYQFSSFHFIEFNDYPELVFSVIKTINFRKSKIISILFNLRGLPRSMDSFNGFLESGFILLEEKKDEEIVLGFLLEGKGLKKTPKKDFIKCEKGNIVKGVWNFKITEYDSKKILSTETRVYCNTRRTRFLFSIYWFFISYFSGLIRKIILKLIKQELEEINYKG